MFIRHSQPRRGADSHAPNHSFHHYANDGKLCIFGRPRLRYARLCLPSHGHRRRFLDRHWRSAPSPLPFGNPTWQSSLDGSKVRAKQLASIAAGSDASCPNAGAIGCLLLQSIGSQPVPTGGKFMTRITFIQRLNTKEGCAPADGCAVPGDVGKQTLVRYSADYYFFRGAE